MTSVIRSIGRGWRFWISAYALLLLFSHLTRFLNPPAFEPAPSQHVVDVGNGVHIAYYDFAPNKDIPVVLLLHGSPMGVEMFDRLLPVLAQSCRVIAPDMIGYGASTREAANYSIRTQADYMLRLMNRLDVKKVHMVGYSLGGAVGIHLADQVPDRVQSLTLLASIGVQELELLGDYYLNRGIHGIQLGLIWGLHEWVPHFGWLDDVILNMPYARSFYDTNQGPLRGMLKRYRGPIRSYRQPKVPIYGSHWC